MYNLKDKKFIIFENQKILEAIKRINLLKKKILFVVNAQNKLVGSISSGDIRRSIRKKIDPNDNLKKIMCKSPKFFYENQRIKNFQDFLISLPILNKKKKIVRLQFSEGTLKKNKNTVFLMAGGKGKRLMPLTKKTPKPLLKIKGGVLYDTPGQSIST